MSGVGSSPALATCETRQVRLMQPQKLDLNIIRSIHVIWIPFLFSLYLLCFCCQVVVVNPVFPPIVCQCTDLATVVHEPRCEKTGLRGFRPGPT